MAGYVSVNRLSRVQLSSEDRKQQAHIKKIGEMQSRSGLDTSKPAEYAHRSRNFSVQSKEKNKQIAKENDVQLTRLLNIMQSKTAQPARPYHPTSPTRRQQSVHASQNYAQFRQRVANTKGTYHISKWDKEFEEHKEHLKISKDNKLFTPRDIGANRQRIKTISVPNSKRTTPTSSTVSMAHQPEKQTD